MIKVFGHKAPDTDSTGSPIIWAWYLTEVKGTPATAMLLGEPNTEALFVLDHWNLPKPAIMSDVGAGDTCVIVDTNNPAELPASINEAEVIEIIDHHMLVGGIKTKNADRHHHASAGLHRHHPARSDRRRTWPAPRAASSARCCPASCPTRWNSARRPPPRMTAPWPRQLANMLGVSIPDLAEAQFAAKSDVSAFSDAELLRMDSKEYNVAGKELRVSVLETTAPAVVLDRKASLMAAMPAIAKEDGADQVLLFVIDILREEATLLVPNDLVKSLAEASFGAKVTGDTVVLPGIMSRKKQIIPSLKL